MNNVYVVEVETARYNHDVNAVEHFTLTTLALEGDLGFLIFGSNRIYLPKEVKIMSKAVSLENLVHLVQHF